MSESYHQGVYLFSDGFERSTHQEHQYRKRDKLMVQGFDAAPPPLVAIEEEEEFKAVPAYESGGMLSEMFNFPASDLLESQIPTNYRPPRPTNNVEWYGTKHGAVGSLDSFGDSKQHIRYSNNNNGLDDNIAENEISVINANSTSSMQLFLMNPQQRSPSPPPPPPPPASNHSLQIFRNSPIQQQQFTWGETAAALDNENKIQGLSLSLSSSLQQFEVAKAAGQLRMGGDGRFYYNQGVNTYPLKSFGDQAFHFQGGGHSHEFHNGFGSLGEVGFLRSSKYVKAAQELLEEFCSVGKGLLKKRKLGRQNPNPNLADVAMSSSDVGCVGVSSSSSRDLPPLSPSERFEHQKRKAKFLSMLDEVDGRYNNYIEQLQMVVNSFDSVLGFGAASPYTALTQKAMSRHFRCLKDAISVQLKLVCELLGDKEGAVKPPGITKGETPRLRFLEQCLRQQRSFNQIGMMEHEAWRPQRGLPERSVNILRAWLFEHFLHPYPSDADKHLLARRTGLSRNQVSNWFINARVRLWKPMVEDMYQQEARAEEETGGAAASTLAKQQTTSAQTPKPTPPSPPPGKRYQMDALDNDPSHNTINKNKRQAFTETQANTTTDAGTSPGIQRFSVTHGVPDDTCRVETDYGNGTHVRASGDVSLTLGLRHAGNFGG